ncbi:MAG: hypothetical protein LAT68_00505 [Cyclobacteriaceae bacterium]|nr:hypothetical protein [Cyclobacteriaceae bacterium]MCH8514783.1 hypothetical protein [Cyclobacteriaceae bacterium]
MINEWKSNVDEFIELAYKNKVRMLMVGGGAVNFHGYQRHSAVVDFWIDHSLTNLENLKITLLAMGFEMDDFPESVKSKNQNISLKFSPEDLDVELITRFDIGKTFEQAYEESILVEVNKKSLLKWRVLSYEDLIISKLRASRPKDLLDIQQLRSNRGEV